MIDSQDRHKEIYYKGKYRRICELPILDKKLNEKYKSCSQAKISAFDRKLKEIQKGFKEFNII